MLRSAVQEEKGELDEGPHTEPGGLATMLGSLSLRNRARKLLVLDINGLLLQRIFPKDLHGSLARSYDCKQNGRLIFLRPHCRSFVRWCLEHFWVVVWSTGMRKNVLPLVSFTFPEEGQQPAAILDQNDCTPTGVFHTGNKHKMLQLKQLQRLWSRPDIQRLDGGPFDPHNTLLLDDSPYKAIANPPHTAVHPMEWAAANTNEVLEEALGPEGHIRNLLVRYAHAEDGHEVVKEWNATAREFWMRPEDDPNYAALLKLPLAKRASWGAR